MLSTEFSHKRIGKVSSDNLVIGFDLVSNLTYMAILSLGNLARDQLLEHSSRQRLKTAVFFDYVHVLVKRLGFEYTRAFQLVSEKARASNVKSLLLRFAASISSGESEKEFIAQEARAEGERYANEYEKGVENLRKWTDAYAAILISVTLIMVVSLVSTMMGSLGETVIIVVAFALFFITCIGVYIIYKVAPVEQITYETSRAITKYRLMARRLALLLTPVGLVLALLVGPQFGVMAGFSVAFLIIGICLLPTGFFAWKDDTCVRKLDEEIPTFLRSVGNVAGSTGIILTEAVKRLDTKSMGTLKTHIDRLNVRLGAHLPTKECWEAFRQETGSELVNRSTRMLVDGSELGGRSDQVGEICSTYAANVTHLRSKRALTASTFAFLTVPMHATMTFILVFVLEIVSNFSSKLTGTADILARDEKALAIPETLQMPPGMSIPGPVELASGMDLFGPQDMVLGTYVIIVVITILTFANALAPKFAGGGSNLKILSFLSIMCIISGCILGSVPMVTANLFDL